MGHLTVMMVTNGTPYCDDGYKMEHLTVMMITNVTPYCDDGYNIWDTLL